MKFLIGYSGWSAGQLDGELKQESWAVTTMSSPGDCLAAEGDAFWREIVKGMGDGYKLWLNSPAGTFAQLESSDELGAYSRLNF